MLKQNQYIKKETANPHHISFVCFKRHFEFNSHKVSRKAEQDVGDSEHINEISETLI